MIGIDPDVEKNGVAIRTMGESFRGVTYLCIPFWKLVDYLETLKSSADGGTCDIHVVIEAGHLNKKSNFRSGKQNSLVSDATSRQVGRNHQTGILLGEWCESRSVSYEWHIPRSPWVKKAIEDHKFYCDLTKYNGDPLNKETRSAGMLVYERSWPIKKRVR